ncbi:MAG TPA: hypothetical protein VK929_17250 [Longimicrobiales bacterium]|nr:hypothetical protein [Longimicrobiales bacterium]
MAEPRDTVTTEPAEARGAPTPHERAEDRHREGQPRAAPALARVRDDDLEPHDGLRYVAKLFKVLALLLIFMLIAEVIIGFQQDGMAALSMLLVEATRLIVFAGFLWGAGDMAILLIESNHDLRASRILLGRLNGKVERLVDGTGPEEPAAGGPLADTPSGGAPPRPPR